MAIDPRKITHWLIRADQPFRGFSQSFLTEAGTVAYTDGLTVAEYEAQRGFPVRTVTTAELDELTRQHADAQLTAPTEESEEAFFDALNVLPPSRWHRCKGVEMFHISERLTLDLVHWHARFRGRCYTFTHRDGTHSVELADMVRAAAELEA